MNRRRGGQKRIEIERRPLKKTRSVASTSPSAPERPKHALAEESILWGFPVYFSTEKDQEKRLTADHGVRSEIAADKNIRLAEDEANRVDLLEKADVKADYTVYMYYAYKYGPLDGIMYCSTGRPGKGVFCPKKRHAFAVTLICVAYFSIRGVN